MNDRTHQTLLARIEALEDRERRRRCLFGICAALLVVPLLVAARFEGRTVEAERFLLRGRDGDTRAVWQVRDGAVELSLRDPKSRERVILAVGADGRPTLDLRDAEEKLRVRLLVTRESSLNFYDPAGRLRAGLGVTSYGPYPVRPYGQNRRLTPGVGDDFFGGWGTPASDPEAPLPHGNDGPVLKLYDAGGKPRLEARVDGNEPFIFLHSPEGNIRHVALESRPPDEDREPRQRP